MYSKVTIVGVGMMGGSLGLAVKERGLASEVMGWGRNEERLKAARRIKTIDRWTLDREEALAGTELLVFATPMIVATRLAPEWFPATPPGCLITDLGSVKANFVQRLTDLADRARAYVSSHPLCGSEKAGVAAARPDLFAGRLCLLTPVSRTKRPAVGEIQKFWQKLGMKVVSLSPARHDQLVAAVSHLPHLVAFSLINQAGDEKMLEFAGTGFLDTTRIAASDPALWAEILISNRKEVLREIALFQKNLGRVKDLLAAGDENGLREWMRRARRRRLSLE